MTQIEKTKSNPKIPTMTKTWDREREREKLAPFEECKKHVNVVDWWTV